MFKNYKMNKTIQMDMRHEMKPILIVAFYNYMSNMPHILFVQTATQCEFWRWQHIIAMACAQW